MTKMFRTFAAATVLAAAASGPALAQDGEPIQIGWTAWSDAEFMTKLAQKLITDELGQEVELVQTDIAPQYQGLAQGDIDLMLMAWLPGTHADYMERVGDDVTTLGVLYTDAKLGWVVPAYVPEDQLSSIEDLKNDEVADRLGNQIQGIDPGAGLMRLSEQALEDYGLDGYQLVSASGAAMTAALDRAVRNEEWIVVTGWSPHWKFGKYDLRYLDDPEGTLGGTERVYALSRQGFQGDHPEVAKMLMRMWLPLDELESAMANAQDTSYEEAVEQYIADNQSRVNYWVTGEIGG
ncbi:glycine betaine ABC transporter substrate-binding protein [Lutibaculum baratangense]|uniref:L-proline glycine betaine binding ABC transporter protein ProX n=1 Tax=Lutibaculum baratangense AMV1 TaxID=631454 RepID=V4R175_9HYPH|nr:L-proline glycine betaine binding ABC transporter protein ProX [Lutibaculum baratangense AMV1]